MAIVIKGNEMKEHIRCGAGTYTLYQFLVTRRRVRQKKDSDILGWAIRTMALIETEKLKGIRRHEGKKEMWVSQTGSEELVGQLSRDVR